MLKKVGILYYFVFFFISISLFSGGIILYRVSSQDNYYTTTAKAEETGPDFCSKNCSGDSDPCTGTKIGDNYYDPGCCGEIKSTGDPFACGNWVNRTWCFEDECSTIPADVNRQRCGGARSVYCEKCKANGCYTTPTPSPTQIPPTTIPTITPSPAAASPTSTPSPTSTQIYMPLPLPSSGQAAEEETPTPIPTIASFPTIIISSPLDNPVNSPEIKIPELALPEIELPRFRFNVVKLNQTTRKPLGFFDYLFNTVRSLDQKLESKINEEIGKWVWKRVRKPDN